MIAFVRFASVFFNMWHSSTTTAGKSPDLILPSSKREVKILGTSVYKLEKQMTSLYWAILCGLGALSLALITIFLAK